MKLDAQNFEELIHLDNQPVAKATASLDDAEDLVNSNANESSAPPPTSPLRAFDENNTITQDNLTAQQGRHVFL